MKFPRVASAIASCGGLGYSPVAPGTAGSIGAAVAHYVLRGFVSLELLCGIGFGLTFLGFWATQQSITAPSDDPSWIVIDEWCAVWFLCCVLPCSAGLYFLGCVVFRVLDIAKAWPVSLAERAPGAWGIFLDDFVAAFLAGVFVWAVAL